MTKTQRIQLDETHYIDYGHYEYSDYIALYYDTTSREFEKIKQPSKMKIGSRVEVFEFIKEYTVADDVMTTDAYQNLCFGLCS